MRWEFSYPPLPTAADSFASEKTLTVCRSSLSRSQLQSPPSLQSSLSLSLSGLQTGAEKCGVNANHPFATAFHKSGLISFLPPRF